MFRRSAKSIGLVLLLWIGIVLPVAGEQVSHFAGSSDVGAVFHTGLNDGDGDDTALSQNQCCDEHSQSAASADLSDFTFAPQPPRVSAAGNPLMVPRIAAAFTSWALPPEDRPPIVRTA